jgi:SpoVK/Ycf46/Vps4 family AAA+-type ATPase
VLGRRAIAFNGQLDRIVDQFSLDAGVIARIGATVEDADSLWDQVRRDARPALDELAQRLPGLADWNDLVLPPVQLDALREIAVQVRHQARVYETWGFGRTARGLGVTALFAGPSGVGKTLAAEVLARELRLDIYCIDLSQVVNKYIGETEKNLRRVFDAADGGGVVLLFDEADALFGKRTEVHDSHDRYANIEVSYLLQRMESYRGLAILTTNFKGAIDPAFLRRLRFIVNFPFPDGSERARIWQAVFPPQMPRDGLDFARLAQLNITGGNIRGIALHASFTAAEDGRPVTMAHVLRAARTEYAKLDRTLTETEIAGWR